MKTIVDIFDKISNFISPKYKRYEFEQSLFLTLSFIIGCFALLQVPFNLFLGFNSMHIVFECLYAFFSFYFWHRGKKYNQFMKKTSLISSFLAIGTLVFFNGGVFGTIPWYMTQVIVFSILITRGRDRKIVVFSQIVISILIIIVEFLFPGLIVPYASLEAHYSDIIFSFFLILGIFLIVFLKYTKAYDRERDSLIHRLDNLSEQMRTDYLTKVYNKMYITEKIRYYADDRSGKFLPFSICMCDIDFFKKVNDTYGHDIGDEVLIRVANKIKTTIRQQDSVGRVGGEEFMLLFPLTSASEAHIACEKVRMAIQELEFTDLNVTDLNVTMSFGIAELSTKFVKGALIIENIDDLIKRSDDCLYHSKRNGRNQITTYLPPEELEMVD